MDWESLPDPLNKTPEELTVAESGDFKIDNSWKLIGGIVPVKALIFLIIIFIRRRSDSNY